MGSRRPAGDDRLLEYHFLTFQRRSFDGAAITFNDTMEALSNSVLPAPLCPSRQRDTPMGNVG